MKRKTTVFIAFFVCVVTAAFGMERFEAEGLFRKATLAYNDGQIDDAVRLNEQIIQGGLEGAAIYYNLGNSYLKKRNLGKAIVNYLRAETFVPRDADLRANLGFARDSVENYVALFSARGIFRIFPVQKFTNDELRWLSLLSLMVASGFCLIGIYTGIRRKRIVFWTVILSLGFAYFSSMAVLKAVSESGHAVCVIKAEAKFEPSKEATTYFKLPEGTELRVLRKKEDWFKIQRPDGKTGWVSADAVEKI